LNGHTTPHSDGQGVRPIQQSNQGSPLLRNGLVNNIAPPIGLTPCPRCFANPYVASSQRRRRFGDLFPMQNGIDRDIHALQELCVEVQPDGLIIRRSADITPEKQNVGQFGRIGHQLCDPSILPMGWFSRLISLRYLLFFFCLVFGLIHMRFYRLGMIPGLNRSPLTQVSRALHSHDKVGIPHGCDSRWPKLAKRYQQTALRVSFRHKQYRFLFFRLVLRPPQSRVSLSQTRPEYCRSFIRWHQYGNFFDSQG